MNQKTFERIRQCYVAKGINVNKSYPFLGGGLFIKYITNDGVQEKAFQEKAFLRDAKRRGFYCEPTAFRHLELPENVLAQETKLCEELGWTKEELNTTLASLAENDAVCLTETVNGRKIGLALATQHLVNDKEVVLFGKLAEYVSHE
jgi:hypothetical protein